MCKISRGKTENKIYKNMQLFVTKVGIFKFMQKKYQQSGSKISNFTQFKKLGINSTKKLYEFCYF
jgi:hypothetical protein